MSGAVEIAQKVIQAPAQAIERNVGGTVGDIFKNTFSRDTANSAASLGALSKGKLGGAVKPYVQRAGEIKAQVTGQDQQAPVNIAAPVDVAAEQDRANKERARAKRQAEIDILTDRPGRGGTILTDQYTYKV